MHQSHRPSPSSPALTAQAPRRRSRWLLASAIALAVAFTPAVDLIDDAWAKGGNGNGGGNSGGGNSGGGNGGGNGGGGNGGGGGGGDSAGRGGGGGNGGRGGNGAGRGGEGGGFAGGHGRGAVEKTERNRGRGGSPADIGAMIGNLRDAFKPGGAERAARERYAAASGWSDADSRSGRGRGFGEPRHEVDSATTASLVALGWEAPEAVAETGFRNHGHRVSSMVEIAKALGYGAHVGALQANFGTAAPTMDDGDAATREELGAEIGELETTLATLEAPESEDAAALRERLEELRGELADRDEEAAETTGREGDWRTADLDITGDGVVDLADLEAARQLAAAPADDDVDNAADDATLADDAAADETLADTGLEAEKSAEEGGEVVEAGL